MSTSPTRYLVVLLTAVAVVGIGFGWFGGFNQEAPLPNFGKVGVREFVTADGAPLSTAELKGGVWAAHLFFTRCQGVCPLLMSRVERVVKSFENRNGISFLSVTADPQFDTPEKLLAYEDQRPALKAKPKGRWVLVTGEQQAINGLFGEDFKLGTIENPDLHSPRIALVDKNLTVRALLPLDSEESVADVIASIERLLDE